MLASAGGQRLAREAARMGFTNQLEWVFAGGGVELGAVM